MKNTVNVSSARRGSSATMATAECVIRGTNRTATQERQIAQAALCQGQGSSARMARSVSSVKLGTNQTATGRSASLVRSARTQPKVIRAARARRALSLLTRGLFRRRRRQLSSTIRLV
eukprot:SAG11_NODE_25152_length_363_cov_0.715909_1_plen_117_part_10